MTDTQTLWLVLALVYGLECLAWLRPGALGFRSFLGRRWRTLQGGLPGGNRRGVIAWLHPLPPLGRVLLARVPPVAFCESGVLVPGLPGASAIRWAGLSACPVEGRHVFLGGRRRFDAGSEAMAHHAATGINRALKAGPGQRAAVLRRWLEDTFDTAALRLRLDAFAAASRRLRLRANALFTYLFVLAPLIVAWFGLWRCWWALLPGLLLFTVPLALEFRRAHAELHPALAEERGSHFLLVLLSPSTAVRAVDALSKPLVETFHPLAAARVLSAPGDFERLAGETLRHLQHPRRTLPPESLEWEQFQLAAVENFLRREGMNPEALLDPPAPSEPEMRSYCPRCRAQFTLASGDCADCGEVALSSFNAPPAPVTR